ncbi:BZ3500_MvSof-1268-A1-R1_Chr11-3g03580 [Microbotryum saponariae]|uniref:DNA polymerase delta subunit 3 n=1 Tax=Microbotryum saponariae TaxID=289078 RepID=A0A2X0KTJ9_9BASI|nr:BZ3500_MvSof-1268-A1-R1_Chr11-3g03580 [Microbotryum saponariae]SDA03589.1 BZ3501_MvSof-1269-A2-R1_Chr11g03157 [Microbotryum saponariae]
MEMDQKVAFRHLTKRIAIDQQPLSYRVASRELGITIQDAKVLLAAFLEDPSTQARGITATYCLCGQVATQPKEDDDDHAMDLDSQHASQLGSPALTSIVLLVPQAELEAAQNRFLTPPQSHVYALHSTPLASTSDLSVHTLPLLSTEALRAKWKPIPLGGYGEIVHPNGERKKSSSQTGKKAFTNKASTSAKPTTTLLGTKLESAKASTSNSDIPSSRSTKKPAASTVRKIGQPGGLFARREPTPSPVAPKVVPSKRKASPKKKQNGLFAEEELASDEEEEEDLWDEEALREAEEMALKGDTKTKAPAAAVETKKKETASAPKKAAVLVAAPAKKFGAGSSTTGGAKAGASKPAQQKGIGSFFTKQA